MDEFLAEAVAVAEQFIGEHPGYSLSDQAIMWQGATNRIVRAQYRGQPVVFKFFRQGERWKRELYGLHHFSQTELVPLVIDGSHTNLVVMTELPYTDLPDSMPGTVLSDLDVNLASQSLGQATAKLVQERLSSEQSSLFEQQFYGGLALEDYLGSVLDAAHEVQISCELYQLPVFQQSLALLDARVPTLLQQPRLLYHQDASNVCFLGDQVSGFFELEMCRIGTLSMQLGSLFVLFQWRPLRWGEFLCGFQTAISRGLESSEVMASLGFAHFMVWRYITRYGEWDGQFKTEEEAAQEIKDALEYAVSLSYYNAIVQEGNGKF